MLISLKNNGKRGVWAIKAFQRGKGRMGMKCDKMPRVDKMPQSAACDKMSHVTVCPVPMQQACLMVRCPAGLASDGALHTRYSTEFSQKENTVCTPKMVSSLSVL